MVSAADHPAVSAWAKPNTMRNTPRPPSTAPATSMRGRLAGRLPRIKISAPATAMAAKIRLTYRVHRQDRSWVRNPPRIRPITATRSMVSKASLARS